MKGVILFDIDHTLIDTVRVKVLTVKNLALKLNISQRLLKKIVREYTDSLKTSTDFNPDNYLSTISKHFAKNKDELSEVFFDRATYSMSLFPEIQNVLAKLSTSTRLGVFSEGFVDFQTRKLILSDIYKYFDKKLIFISKRKMLPGSLKKLPPKSVIIEDNLTNAEVSQDLGIYKVLWVNRKDRMIQPKIDTIYSLGDLLNKDVEYF